MFDEYVQHVLLVYDILFTTTTTKTTTRTTTTTIITYATCFFTTTAAANHKRSQKTVKSSSFHSRAGLRSAFWGCGSMPRRRNIVVDFA